MGRNDVLGVIFFAADTCEYAFRNQEVPKIPVFAVRMRACCGYIESCGITSNRSGAP